ncbi:MAG TPA: tetratricopeptide repeat protein [Bryobacteraceae bacterium]|nr:tetratricopeptide repeat protein [Bryobacteraceae bacterium]
MRSENGKSLSSLHRSSRVQFNMTPESIRAQTRKIIASRTLVRSERLARFLEFTVSESLAGNTDQLKEFVIGVEVFDRKQDYDPRLDPIVRVEARRLRMKLKKYYETEGRSDALRIEYPKGSYAPAIRITDHAERTDTSKSRRGIAVLPFSHSANEECEYFTDGLTEEMIASLTKVNGLRVVAWNSSLRLKGTPRDYARVGEQLQVDVVLEGSVRLAGPNTLRIAVQLVWVSDGSYLWTETFERPLQEVFSVRDAIAAEVARTLHVNLGPPRPQTRSREAYQFYLKGRFHWNKRTDESVARGAEYLENAIAADPEYALAYAGLADCHIVLAKFGAAPPREAMPKARAAARRALTLDPTLAEAHVSLGSIAGLFDWDWVAAEQHMRRGLEMNPLYATGHQWYAHDVLAAVGRLEQAEAALARARDCDPLSVVVMASSAENLIMQRRPEEALDLYGKTLELDPYFPRAHFGKARAALSLGREEQAREAVRAGWALNPSSPLAIALVTYIYAAIGRVADARRSLQELEEAGRKTQISPYLFMRAWMAMDPRRACDYLEQACEDRDPRLAHAAVSPIYDDLRGHPRFDAVLRRMGLTLEPVDAMTVEQI